MTVRYEAAYATVLVVQASLGLELPRSVCGSCEKKIEASTQ
jgi:hypothetical protein